ncbi:hypothetical protein M8C21_017550 [Ambrosia artemisiifolia]|uniref:Uncharacterized protein n=1 Tax=Ambrosia artemisiifolia TaxID=4212 RepID=A0AAD5GYY7_AMBAR|nr:hypothetical protein M8C21_017550 [Ambrosia artemisiifolia]
MKLFLFIFLSLTPAIAKYVKTGCNKTCGNVRIPYPFGIGVGCSANQWYNVDCKSLRPYLSKLNNLEVLGVSLEYQTVTVSMQKISYCQNPISNNHTKTVDLDRSPFLFSKSHNKFVFEGCGAAAMMDNGSVVTGCSTACLNNTFGDINNCFGNRCCQTVIPHYFKSYNINIYLTGLEDGSCGSAFLVEDETLYEQERFSDSFTFKNSSFVPVSLLWTLSDSDHVACCYDESPEKLKVNVSNGNSLDTLKCFSYSDLSLESNPYLRDGCVDPDETKEKYAKTGCREMCGNVRIPFPFGIGASCSINQWYTINCVNSTPYLPGLNHIQVLGVDLENQTVTVSTPRITDCKNPTPNSSEIMGINLGRSPFLFSKLHNKFVFEGCGIAAMMDNGNVLTGCATACHGVVLSNSNNCFGIGCCETSIPYYLKSYTISLTGLKEESGDCGSAFLMDETLYDPYTFRNSSFIPVSLRWTLAYSDQVTCCYYGTLIISKLIMFNGTTLDTWNCSYIHRYPPHITGNPYLIDGCFYNYSTGEEEPTEVCKKCRESGGYCRSYQIYDVDGLLFRQNFACYHDGDGQRTSLGVILGNVFYMRFCCTTCKFKILLPILTTAGIPATFRHIYENTFD